MRNTGIRTLFYAVGVKRLADSKGDAIAHFANLKGQIHKRNFSFFKPLSETKESER